MKNIVLTGFMGTGKTTIGRVLAQRLGFSFADTDDLIIEKAGKSINDIFKQDGEEIFRDIESECILSLENCKNIVIATGGGAVLRESNITALRKNGIIFNLTASNKTILHNISLSDQRPLVNNSNSKDIIKRFESRKPYYNNCDFKITIDDKTPIEVANEIILIYKNKTGGI